MVWLFLSFQKDFLSPFDWAVILLHKSFFSVAGINRELLISLALQCPLFFVVCFLFESLVQANLFHTILYFICFDQAPSTPFQAFSLKQLSESSPKTSPVSQWRLQNRTLRPSSIVRVVSSEKLVWTPAIICKLGRSNMGNNRPHYYPYRPCNNW